MSAIETKISLNTDNVMHEKKYLRLFRLKWTFLSRKLLIIAPKNGREFPVIERGSESIFLFENKAGFW